MKEKQISGFGFVFVLLVFVSKCICVNVYAEKRRSGLGFRRPLVPWDPHAVALLVIFYKI